MLITIFIRYSFLQYQNFNFQPGQSTRTNIQFTLLFVQMKEKKNFRINMVDISRRHNCAVTKFQYNEHSLNYGSHSSLQLKKKRKQNRVCLRDRVLNRNAQHFK